MADRYWANVERVHETLEHNNARFYLAARC